MVSSGPDAAKCPAMYRTATHTQNDPAPNVNSAEVEKLTLEAATKFKCLKYSFL